ncbi:sodium-dependent transporter [Peribacillus sp. SCS-26]|uniref:sodium-dependent transporter n=1 Tax=Paraperibacillus marinus TaxID=3115295 RepID=UPI003905C768
MDNRPQWGTRAGFIMAAIGSAIGLGNIWRFPAVAYDNGGGAFFIPYLFALLTAGIPILIMEFTIGHKYRGSSPLAFARFRKNSEWLGWWQVAISFVIATYYAAIIAWAMSFAVFSFKQNWGDDPAGFFFGKYLKLAETPGDIGGIVPGVLIPIILVWIVTLGILLKGIKKGIEVANKVMIPTLVVLFLIIVVRALTLDGAAAGLDAFFKPDWGEIANPKVWVAAYGQIFFSLSVGFAIMITYSSYLPKKTDISNNAFITGFANSGFELLAGIGVFAALGFMAQQQGVPVDKVVSSGVGLAFTVFPKIISEFPAFNGILGFAFFACLTLAGLTSLISIVETFVAGVQDKFNVSRTKSVAVGGGLAAVISILFATKSGLYFLDAADYFINQFGIVIAGLVEIILVAWVARELKNLQAHANSMSDIIIGAWWKVCLGVITPLVLGYMTIQNFISNFKNNYEDYPTSFIIYSGWAVAVAALAAGFVFMALKWKKNTKHVEEDEEVSV